MSRHIKTNGEGQILRFLDQSAQSFLRIVTYVLTSHVDKVVDLSFFKAGYIAISGAQIAFWKCFNSLFSL